MMAIIAFFLISLVAVTAFINPLLRLTGDEDCSSFCPVTNNDCASTRSPVLGGVDVVSFFKLPNNTLPGIAGSNKYVSTYNGYSFWFSSADNKALFDANAKAYIPQYGGFCAHGVSGEFCPQYPWQKSCLGPSGNWGLWVIYNNKLYLNYEPGAQQIFLSDLENNVRAGDKRWIEWWGQADTYFSTNCFVIA